MTEPLTISRPAEDESPTWVPVDACTLPTVEQPLRVAELDALFAETLMGVEQASRSEALFQLAGGAAEAARVQSLADRETACCSFFTFTVTRTGPGSIALAVTVPDGRAEVLAALVRRAQEAHHDSPAGR